MGNTLESQSTTISTWYELNYNNNESKLSVNRRPAMGSTTYKNSHLMTIAKMEYNAGKNKSYSIQIT